MFRRTTAILATAAAISLAVAAPAGAEAPSLDSYGATASATALELTLGGLLGEPTTLTVASTAASVGDAPTASADGRALATPLLPVGDGAAVTSAGPATAGEDCVDVALPAPIDLAGLELVCVRTNAEALDGDPSSTSSSDTITLDVISAELVGQVVDTVLRPILEQALAGITPLLGDIGLDEVITPLLDTISAGDVLVRIQVDPTASATSASTDGVIADASTGIASIQVLPALGPLATVSVAETGAKVIRDATTGAPTLVPTFDLAEIQLGNLTSLLSGLVANVSDTLAPLLGDVLGGLLGDLTGIVDQLLAALNGVDDTIASLLGTLADSVLPCDGPLAAVICLSIGGVNELDEAELTARGIDLGAGAVGLEVTTLAVSVLDGTLDLALGESVAAAAATPAQPGNPRQAPPAAPGTPALPKTGGDAGLSLTLGLLAVGAAGAALLRRSRSAA